MPPAAGSLSRRTGWSLRRASSSTPLVLTASPPTGGEPRVYDEVDDRLAGGPVVDAHRIGIEVSMHGEIGDGFQDQPAGALDMGHRAEPPLGDPRRQVLLEAAEQSAAHLDVEHAGQLRKVRRRA